MAACVAGLRLRALRRSLFRTSSRLTRHLHALPSLPNADNPYDPNNKWGVNSAQTAYILLRLPLQSSHSLRFDVADTMNTTFNSSPTSVANVAPTEGVGVVGRPRGLSAQTPLLLLPVNIETRFMSSGNSKRSSGSGSIPIRSPSTPTSPNSLPRRSLTAKATGTRSGLQASPPPRLMLFKLRGVASPLCTAHLEPRGLHYR